MHNQLKVISNGGIFLAIDIPPSVNSAYRATFQKGHTILYKSKVNKEFSSSVVQLVNSFKGDMSIVQESKSLIVSAYILYNRKNWDLDNRAKALLDALQESKVIQDDKYIECLYLEKLNSAIQGKKKINQAFVFVENYDIELTRSQHLNYIEQSIEDNEPNN